MKQSKHDLLIKLSDLEINVMKAYTMFVLLFPLG